MERIVNKARNATKYAYQKVMRPRPEKTIVFIVGCQRSGTSMLRRTFARDFLSYVYGESGLSRGAARGTSCRLLPYDQVEVELARQKAPLLVLKPLTESQHVSKMLERFPNSVAVWAYRDYRDVARSQHARFGIGSTSYNLRAVIDPALSDHWCAENVSEKTRGIISKFFSEDRPPHDLHALKWYMRNILFFEQGLEKHARARFCKYEDLVSQPARVMRDIYGFLGRPYPGDGIVRHIHTRSIGKGRELEITPEIGELCRELLDRMNDVYAGRQSREVAGNAV